jgi:hypothetical protein
VLSIKYKALGTITIIIVVVVTIIIRSIHIGLRYIASPPDLIHPEKERLFAWLLPCVYPCSTCVYDQKLEFDRGKEELAGLAY